MATTTTGGTMREISERAELSDPGSYFVSDLHLFARRSEAERHTAELLEAARLAHTFVLGGDIFDFRWTRLETVERTIDAAIQWLDRLVQPHPDCEFHYVLGNHDHVPQFTDRLDALACQRPNLHWHPYWVRLGKSLFLHGDVADRRMNQARLTRRRRRARHHRKRGTTANLLYDLAVQARLHKLASNLVHHKPIIAQRLITYMDDIGQDTTTGLRNVYFGHTHAPMDGFEFGGLTFHNGGAPIKGLEFAILETVL